MRSLMLSLVLLLVVLVPDARADRWFESYEKGRVALQSGQHDDAVRYLTEAIDQKPESKANARTYGTHFIDYFPYVYRGIAYARLGRTALALRDFQAEQAAGEADQGTRDTRAAMLLRQHLRELTPPAAAKTRPPSDRTEPKGTSPGTVASSGSGAAARSAADSLFEQAAEHLSRGQMVAAKRVLEDVERLNRTYPGLAERRQVIRSREQEIQRGIATFLRGDYQGAIDVLLPSAAAATDAPHLHAFLGASYAARYLLSGGEESALLEQARQAFLRTRQIDTQYELDRNVISPPIRRIFDTVHQP
ncbi:MAG TPA: hypothetical protein VLT13_01880 [Bacteroidota bacterium]|nr:hypothetical protein [Bacteroidota bacterium]